MTMSKIVTYVDFEQAREDYQLGNAWSDAEVKIAWQAIKTAKEVVRRNPSGTKILLRGVRDHIISLGDAIADDDIKTIDRLWKYVHPLIIVLQETIEDRILD